VTKDVKISYIVADLHHIESRLLEDKNILYNYLMRLLIGKVVDKDDEDSKLVILCDSNTTKVSSINSLSDYYLKIFLLYEKLLDIYLDIKNLCSIKGVKKV